MRKTKVIVTVGPSINSEEKIEELILLGVNVFRINFSHRDFTYNLKSIAMIRKISKKLEKPVAIMQDISGNKIRISKMDRKKSLKEGDILTISKNVSNEDLTINISNSTILDYVQIGETIYLSEGTIRGVVVEKDLNFIRVKILNDGEIGSKQGINFPYTNFTRFNMFNKKDIEDLSFGAKYEVDFIALSFIKSKQDVLRIKRFLYDLGSKAQIIAKIELLEAVKNIDEIIDVSDGVMVARGDLGIEMGLSKLPALQKMIIKKANEKAIPVITSNQVLSSMINNQTPTRAEILDIANVVYDGSDAIMLSNETTIGKYPIESVEILNDVILEAERNYPYHKTFGVPSSDIFADATDMISARLNIKGIVSFSSTGKSIKNISRNRPQKTIFAVTYSPRVQRQLSIVWGVNPLFVITKSNNSNELIRSFIASAKKIFFINKESKFLLTIGSNIPNNTNIHLIKVVDYQVIKKFETIENYKDDIN